MNNSIKRSGKNIILADLGLGIANLHICHGVHGRTPTIAEFILNKVPYLRLTRETLIGNFDIGSGAEFIRPGQP